MRISDRWLREWVAPRLDAKALAERLTLAGLEVGRIEPALPPLAHVVVGRIDRVTPHPNAAHLTVCEVRIGKESVRVVCGAPNVAPGLRVPAALAGATLANGMTIAAATLHGVASEAMLCSAAELGLSDDASGLLVLDDGAGVGTPLAKYLGGDDVVYDLELTPNRGDCLSVLGVAREVAALTGARLKRPRSGRARAASRERRTVKLRVPQDCPRYTGRVLRDMRPDARTPVWMQERLRRAGMRGVHPVVDVMNYVMLELGQPMHAFDLQKLRGGIVVRRAAKNERLTLLDGRSIALPADSVVIADSAEPLALAGIMGGLDCAVGPTTQSVFLESAYFNPGAIARTARTLSLQTESSQRFERGVDPALAAYALERATTLLLDIVGGKAGPVSAAASPRHLPKARTIALRARRIERVLGVGMAANQVETTLKRFGMVVRRDKTGWRVRPPSYRFDIGLEADLIEELGRARGYEHVPAKRPAIVPVPQRVSETQVSDERLRMVLVDRDYQEVITYAFGDPKLQAVVDPDTPPVPLANPISADMAVLRTSLWPGLLQTIRYNQNRQQQRLRVFEFGNRFRVSNGEVRQEMVVAGAATGTVLPEQWGARARGVDFFDVKGDVEAILGAGISSAQYSVGRHAALHPNQTAAIHCGEEFAGYLGALHPDLMASLGLGQSVILFELRLAVLAGRGLPRFREISRFPAIRRDLAVVVDEAVAAKQVIDRIASAAGKLLAKLELFDEYRGEGIDSGRKSLALGLTLQDSSRTLKEVEVDELIGRIITALRVDLGAQLR